MARRLRAARRLGLLLGALLALALSACAAGPHGLARAGGGEDDGIGGTGRGGGGDDDGIGGTGIYGTVTGFGSVWVNGVRVSYDADVPVTRNGAPASAADLRVGQVAWIEADPRDGRLVARSIAVESTLVGRVTARAAAAGTLEVDGRRVALARGAIVLEGPASLDPIAVGDRVEVWGLRGASGGVVASRIDAAGPDATAPRAALRLVDRVLASRVERLSVEGYLTGSPRTGFRVGGLPLDAPDLPEAARGPGDRVWLSGRVGAPGVLRVDHFRLEAPPPPDPLVPGRDPDALLRELLPAPVTPPELPEPELAPAPEPPREVERLLEPDVGREIAPVPTRDRLLTR